MAEFVFGEWIPPLRKGHTRLPGREPTGRVAHIGVNVQPGSRYGLHIDRDTYAQISKRSSSYWKREDAPELWDALADCYEDEDHRIRTDAWCIEHQALALENFDLNMAYFASLDHAEFDRAVTEAVAAQPGMVEVTDLKKWDGTGGLYIMVLDGYCQAYVGTTGSVGVMARVRQHWSNSKAFDRLLFGDGHDSILAIDSFRALDTTRVFAAQVADPYGFEHAVVESFPSKFLLNRIMGGGSRLLGIASAIGVDVVKSRDLRDLR